MEEAWDVHPNVCDITLAERDTKKCDVHETHANTALGYTIQPNKIQTTGLAIRADRKTQ